MVHSAVLSANGHGRLACARFPYRVTCPVEDECPLEDMHLGTNVSPLPKLQAQCLRLLGSLVASSVLALKGSQPHHLLVRSIHPRKDPCVQRVK